MALNKLEEELSIVQRQKKVYLKTLEENRFDDNNKEILNEIDILTEREKEILDELGVL